MHRFEGQDAVLYALGSPFSFRGLPLADCGDGFEWRTSDESLRCWLEDVVFEVCENGEWGPLAASEVHLAAGVARFVRCLTGLAVRASGTALPASAVAEGDEWMLEQDVIVDKAFGGVRTSGGEMRARLAGLTMSGWEGLAAIRGVLAVLPLATIGAFVGLGELVADAAGATVLFDEQGVSYAPRW